MNCVLAGVGGQGTVLASKLLARTALENGLEVRSAETIGMAQRGGCVVSHVRIGRDIYAPLVPMGEADLILGFEPAEAVRCLPYLKQGGTVVVSRKAVRPITAALTGSAYDGGEMCRYLEANVERLVLVDGDEICKQAGSPKVLNVALLGAALGAGVLGVTLQQLERSMAEMLPEKLLKMNLNALHAGMACAEGERES